MESLVTPGAAGARCEPWGLSGKWAVGTWDWRVGLDLPAGWGTLQPSVDARNQPELAVVPLGAGVWAATLAVCLAGTGGDPSVESALCAAGERTAPAEPVPSARPRPLGLLLEGRSPGCGSHVPLPASWVPTVLKTVSMAPDPGSWRRAVSRQVPGATTSCGPAREAGSRPRAWAEEACLHQ